MKKAWSDDKAFSSYPVKVTTRKLDYLFLDFVSHFKKKETKKLTVAPITAKIIVFTTSSERILGKTLNKVPDAVPAFREILVPITSFVTSFFLFLSMN